MRNTERALHQASQRRRQKVKVRRPRVYSEKNIDQGNIRLLLGVRRPPLLVRLQRGGEGGQRGQQRARKLVLLRAARQDPHAARDEVEGLGCGAPAKRFLRRRVRHHDAGRVGGESVSGWMMLVSP